jgi:pyruvate dehydrogenase E1 component alpha subunit
MPGVRVDGDDVLAVREAARAALDAARTQRQPSILETMTYRLRGHSVVDPAKYRSKEETAALREKDPVPLYRERLVELGVLDEHQADEIEKEAEKQVADAVAFADESPDPQVSALFDFVYATPVANAADRLPAEPVIQVPATEEGSRS